MSETTEEDMYIKITNYHSTSHLNSLKMKRRVLRVFGVLAILLIALPLSFVTAPQKAAAADPITVTGGTVTYTDSNGANPRPSPPYAGGYTVRTFTSSGTLTVTGGTISSAQVLVVGGGGPGGYSGAGGGGAGGYLTGAQDLTGTMGVTVGAGGVCQGAVAGNSVFGTRTAAAGGAGGYYSGGGAGGQAGGSGGGAAGSNSTNTHGVGTSGQGHDGGDNAQYVQFPYPGGGGGGAGSVGANASSNTVAGDGGAGASSTILDGTTRWYAGGGGGSSSFAGATQGTGGSGVGGNGAVAGGTSGAAKTGSGGGGGGDGAQGGSGGSGIVIVRYLTQTFTVIYNGNGNTGGTVPTDSNSYLPSDNVTVLGNTGTLVKSGYTFAGWNTQADGGGTNQAPSSTFSMPGADTTLYAKWTINSWSLSITANGGTMGGTTAGSKNYGTAIAITQTPPTGYTFTGWSSTGSVCTGTGGCNFNMPDNAVSVTASYSINSYAVTFDKNNVSATGTMSNQSFNYNETKALTANGFSLTGYTFAGWATTSGGTAAYANSASYTMGSANVTLYAQWTINSYTVQWNNWDNSSLKTESVNYGSAGTPPSNPTRTGYTFTGWDTSYSSITGPTTITAQYSINSWSLSITANGGTMGGTTAGSKNYGTAIAITQTPPTGYTFTGWSSTGSVCTGTGGCNFNMPDNAVSVTASYSINSYAVTFDKNNVSATGTMSNQSFNYNETKALTANGFSLTGYTFAGWATSAGGSVAYVDQASYTMGTASVTLYAKWTINEYTITFDSAGGTSVADITQDYNTAVTAPDAPTKAGYTFTGWLPAVPATMPGGGASLTAQWTANLNTITFDGNTSDGGGTADQSMHTTDVENLTVNGFTKTGYTFAGWATSAGGSVAYADQASYTMGTASVTLYAQWTINSYTVQWNNWDNSSLKTESVNYGSAATPPTSPTRTGYTFTGWDTSYSSITGPTTITAVFTINSYTVRWLDWDSSVLKSESIDYGSNSSAPSDPSRTGYTFTGWDTDGNNITAARDITAQYSINSYAVTFDSQGGSTVTSVNIDYGSALGGSYPSNPTKTGYTFSHWDSSPGGGGTDYSSGAPTITSAVTIYAQWTINSYTVTFDKNNVSATGTMSNQSFNYNETKALTANGFSLTGYTFAGWATSAGGSVAYVDQASYTMGTASVTLYAKWTINEYTITFDSAGGTSVADITQDYNTAVTAPDAPTKAGYTFTGWLPAVPATMPGEDTGLTAQWTINSFTLTYNAGANGDITGASPQTVDYSASGSEVTAVPDANYHFVDWSDSVGTSSRTDTNVTGNITVTANFAIDTHTVTFNSNGGSTVDPITGVNYGSTILAPTAPTKTYYTFIGWYKEAGLTNSWNFGTDTVLDNVTLYAKWTINSYTITFNSAGGSVVSSITQDYGTDITPPADPVRTGYTFTGWLPAVPATMPGGDTELTAQWTINSFTLTYNAGANGDITGASPQTVDYSASGSEVTAVPDANYHFVDWSDSVGTSSRTDTNVTGNITVTANFALTPTYDIVAPNVDYTEGGATIKFIDALPTGATGVNISITSSSTTSETLPSGKTLIKVYSISATDQDGNPVTSGFTAHITFDYSAGADADEANYTVMYWDGTAWSANGITNILVDAGNNKISFDTNHFSDFAILGQDDVSPQATTAPTTLPVTGKDVPLFAILLATMVLSFITLSRILARRNRSLGIHK